MPRHPWYRYWRDLGGLFTGSLTGLEQSFDAGARQNGDLIEVALTPRRPADRRILSRIELNFDAAEGTIRRIRLHESIGDRLEIIFTDVLTNDASAEQAIEAARPD